MSSLNENIEYRILSINECDRISEIDPSQWIEKAWRDVDGHLELVSINYMENDWPDGYETYRDKLKSTIISGGVAFGAFNENGSLVGFATINHDFFGEISRYLLLDSMFVSRPYRGTGLGKKLFKHCANKAYEWGADKLYMCAGSSEDTIAFYKSIGCVNAEEINQILFDQDHRDIQLEYDLRSSVVMKNNFTIEEATSEDEKFIANKIKEYSPKKASVERVHKTMKDLEGNIIGGILSIINHYAKSLYIDILWIKEEYRKDGYGSILMDEVEMEAKEKGVYLVNLDTFDFQAKDFYIKRGYEVYAVLDDCPVNHKRYYLSKIL